MRMKKWGIAVAPIAALALLAGCSSSDDGDDAATSDQPGSGVEVSAARAVAAPVGVADRDRVGGLAAVVPAAAPAAKRASPRNRRIRSRRSGPRAANSSFAT